MKEKIFDLFECYTKLADIEKKINENFAPNLEEEYDKMKEGLTTLCNLYIIEYFNTMGVNTSPSNYISKDDLIFKLNLKDKFTKFLNYMLVTLTEEGFITINDKIVKFTDKIWNVFPSEVLYSNLCERFSDYSNIFYLLRHCAKCYPLVMSGKILGLEVLFPDGTNNFLQNILKGLPKNYNHFDLYKHYIISFFLIIAKKKPLKILEVGGGSGMVTWDLIFNITDDIDEYTFTDISKSSLLDAKKKAEEKGYSFLNCKRFDISCDLIQQGSTENTYDVILAVNVIHAIPSIDAALIYLKKVLKSGGIIVLLETFYLPPWEHLIWGIIDGWWFFDDRWRQNTPLINEISWENVIRSNEFNDVCIVSGCKRGWEKHLGVILTQK